MITLAENKSLLPRVLLGVLLGAFLVVVLRTAWFCDDAFITYRTIDNFLNGHGLRWNVAERVQTYTHPLWLLTLISVHALAGEVFYSTLLFSAALSMAAVALLVYCVAQSWHGAALGVLFCIFSTAFMEFSTSGLENPLSHLLAVIFAMVYFREMAFSKRFPLLVFIASVSAVNRHDLMLLYIPMLFAEILAAWSWRVTAWGALGLFPLIAWEAFTIVYYGFFIPNTAYAKLGAGVPAMSLMAQGMRYLVHSVRHDPLTPALCAAAMVYAFCIRDRKSLGIAFGILLYLAYVVRIGGDFMSGRFLTTPFFLAVALIIRAPRLPERRFWIPAMIGACAMGMTATYPPLLSGPRFGNEATAAQLVKEIAETSNERFFSYPATGLFRDKENENSIVQIIFNDRVSYGKRLRERNAPIAERVLAAGVIPYYAGPKAHFVDVVALCDPLLARLPISTPNRWFTGHFFRKVPKGYVESVLSDTVLIEDDKIAAYYEHLRTITRDPIWSRRRFCVIFRMHLGAYDSLIAHLWAAN